MACRIDKALAPLSTVLQSGQTVEVVTAKHAKPNLGWLSFVVSGKARSAIRHFLKNQQRSESISLGQRLLNRALANLESSFEQVTDLQKEQLVSDAELTEFDDILEDIGLGNRVAYSVARRLRRMQIPNQLSFHEPMTRARCNKRFRGIANQLRKMPSDSRRSDSHLERAWHGYSPRDLPTYQRSGIIRKNVFSDLG